jgi:hypothetical protein
VFGDPLIFRPPTLAPTVVSTDKQLTMPAQKNSKKKTPTEANQEDHHTEEDNGNSLTAEPSQISNQERRTNSKLSRRHELRKRRTLRNHLLKKKLTRKMTRLSTEN